MLILLKWSILRDSYNSSTSVSKTDSVGAAPTSRALGKKISILLIFFVYKYFFIPLTLTLFPHLKKANILLCQQFCALYLLVLELYLGDNRYNALKSRQGVRF